MSRQSKARTGDKVSQIKSWLIFLDISPYFTSYLISLSCFGGAGLGCCLVGCFFPFLLPFEIKGAWKWDLRFSKLSSLIAILRWNPDYVSHQFQNHWNQKYFNMLETVSQHLLFGLVPFRILICSDRLLQSTKNIQCWAVHYTWYFCYLSCTSPESTFIL